MKSRLRLAAAAAAALTWLFPYMWMVATSLRPLRDIASQPGVLFPGHLEWDAYRQVFREIPVWAYGGWSLASAGLIGVFQVSLALPAGYALSKLRFRGRGIVFGLTVACLVVPPQVTFVSTFLLLSTCGLVNTLAGLVLPFFASAFATLLVHQALAAVPDEIIEAARLDGASEFTIVYRIVGPAVWPALVSAFVISFVFHYSDYFWPLVMTTDDRVRTLPLGIALLKEPGSGVRWNVLMAGNVLLSIPTLLLFAWLQRYLVPGVALKAPRSGR